LILSYIARRRLLLTNYPASRKGQWRQFIRF